GVDLLAATDTNAAPDGAGIHVEHLADAKEREDPLAIVASHPAQALPQHGATLRGRGRARLAADCDRILQDRRHEALLARPGRAALEPGEELDRKDGVGLEQAGKPLLGHLPHESRHAAPPRQQTTGAARVPPAGAPSARAFSGCWEVRKCPFCTTWSAGSC